MKISHKRIPAVHGSVVFAFIALCAVIFGFLWTQAGGRIPLISQEGYRVSVVLPDVDNLVFQSDVRVAGIQVGKIEALTVKGRTAKATMELDESVAPLHEGATVTVSPLDIASLSPGEYVDVTVTAPCSENSVVPANFYRGRSLSATASMMIEN